MCYLTTTINTLDPSNRNYILDQKSLKKLITKSTPFLVPDEKQDNDIISRLEEMYKSSFPRCLKTPIFEVGDNLLTVTHKIIRMTIFT